MLDVEPRTDHPTASSLYLLNYCCILRGAGGEHIVDVVPGGTQLETQVKTGSWAGCTH